MQTDQFEKEAKSELAKARKEFSQLCGSDDYAEAILIAYRQFLHEDLSKNEVDDFLSRIMKLGEDDKNPSSIAWFMCRLTNFIGNKYCNKREFEDYLSRIIAYVAIVAISALDGRKKFTREALSYFRALSVSSFTEPAPVKGRWLY